MGTLLTQSASPALGLVGVSGDGRLLQWTSTKRQAKQLTATLPSGRLLGLFGEYRNLPFVQAVFTDRKAGAVHVLRAAVDEAKPCIERLRLQFGGATGCCMLGSLLCVISANAVHAFAPGSVNTAASLPLAKGIVWRGTRFFQQNGEWFALAFDGRELRLDKVPISSGHFALMVFDRQAFGPWAVNRDGSVEPASGQRLKVLTPFTGFIRHVCVSRDGHKLASLTSSGAYGLDLLIDPAAWKRTHTPDWTAWPSWPESRQSLPRMAPKRFSSIFVNRKGELSLISQRSQTWTFSRRPTGEVVLGKSDGVPIGGAGHGFRQFKPLPPAEGMQIKLSMAEWPDGSRAFLDSRWLLHLRSTDPKVPELSIVLATGALAGWASDGRVFGNSVFLPEGPVTPIQAMAEILRQFVVRLR